MVNDIYITTDVHASEPDDTQSLIHAVMLHAAKRTRIVGISVGVHGGEIKLAKKVIKAAIADGLDVGDIPIYSGKQTKGISNHKFSKGETELFIAARYASPINPLLVSVWGSATDLANVIHHKPEIIPNIRVHVIASWNREQDPESHKVLIKAKGLKWISNETDFRKMYQGWPLKKNQQFVEWIRNSCGNLGSLYYKVSKETTAGPRALKMGDTPSFHWAVHYNGGPMTYKTKRKAILNEWKEIIGELYK